MVRGEKVLKEADTHWYLRRNSTDSWDNSYLLSISFIKKVWTYHTSNRSQVSPKATRGGRKEGSLEKGREIDWHFILSLSLFYYTLPFLFVSSALILWSSIFILFIKICIAFLAWHDWLIDLFLHQLYWVPSIITLTYKLDTFISPFSSCFMT